MEDNHSCGVSLDYQPGDLVSLAGDHEHKAGIGFIIVVETEQTTDLADVLEFLKSEEEEIPKKVLLHVMWARADKTLIMHPTDVVIVRKGTRTNDRH